MIRERCQDILDNTVGKCPGPELFTLASLASCMEPIPEDTTARALFSETPVTGIKRGRDGTPIQGRGLTPVRTLGPFKAKGRRRTRKAKTRNRRTRRKKFTA